MKRLAVVTVLALSYLIGFTGAPLAADAIMRQRFQTVTKEK